MRYERGRRKIRTPASNRCGRTSRAAGMSLRVPESNRDENRIHGKLYKKSCPETRFFRCLLVRDGWNFRPILLSGLLPVCRTLISRRSKPVFRLTAAAHWSRHRLRTHKCQETLLKTRIPLCFSFLILASAALLAQSSGVTQNVPSPADTANQARGASSPVPQPATEAPFSRLAFGVGGSPLGLRMMAATDLNRYLNVRVSGAVFKYTLSDLSISDFTVNTHLNLASAGVSLDIFPFPNHGLRFSPGVLFYNDNGMSGDFSVQGGSSFTLNNDTYYASSTNPVTGHGGVALNTRNPAFTITGGWGNMVRRKGHFSFPFEIGVALVGQPSLYINLNSGQVCDATGVHCVNVTSDPHLQSDLQAQTAKYRKDLDPLKTYPILSGGIAYSFRIR
jgi:hypothetical protein